MAEIVKGVNADWTDELEVTRANLKAMSDAVEIQKAEIERLRAALREIVEYDALYGIQDKDDGRTLVRIARAALDDK